jgi:hypothetical protein
MQTAGFQVVATICGKQSPQQAAHPARSDAAQSHAAAVDFYPRVFPEIAAMSREEMALLLHGLACKVQLIRAEWSSRTSYMSGMTTGSECPRITELFAALEDYRTLAFAEDCREKVGRGRRQNDGFGSVYVIEFSDGHIKIGRSITPEKRIQSVAGSNQHSLKRSWISDGLANHAKLETAAHRHFTVDRVGGEFFSTKFETAVSWIAGEWAKHQIAGQVQ